MNLLLIGIVACGLMVQGVLAFDDPPQLPAEFIAKATWTITNPMSATGAAGFGTASMNGPNGQFRIQGQTTWHPNGYVYQSDGLYLCGVTDAFYSSWIRTSPMFPSQTSCDITAVPTVIATCEVAGDGQLPKLGFLHSTTFYGQPSVSYVYSHLLGLGGLSSATFWFTSNAKTLLGLQVVDTDGWITNANVTSIISEVPPSSTFSTVPSPCVNASSY